jgi:hypothetical protein
MPARYEPKEMYHTRKDSDEPLATPIWVESESEHTVPSSLPDAANVKKA